MVVLARRCPNCLVNLWPDGTRIDAYEGGTPLCLHKYRLQRVLVYLQINPDYNIPEASINHDYEYFQY